MTYCELCHFLHNLIAKQGDLERLLFIDPSAKSITIILHPIPSSYNLWTEVLVKHAKSNALRKERAKVA